MKIKPVREHDKHYHDNHHNHNPIKAKGLNISMMTINTTEATAFLDLWTLFQFEKNKDENPSKESLNCKLFEKNIFTYPMEIVLVIGGAGIE